MRSYLNSWKEIDGNPREVKKNGFERVWVSFGVKNDKEGLGKGYLQTHSPKCLVPLNSITSGHVLRAQQQYYARSTSLMSVVQGIMGVKGMNNRVLLSEARSMHVTRVLRTLLRAQTVCFISNPILLQVLCPQQPFYRRSRPPGCISCEIAHF